MRRCENCKKIELLYRQKKFCSNRCKFEYFKKNKIGPFYNSELQRDLCLRAHKKYPNFAKHAASFAVVKNKHNKTGLYDKEISQMGWKYQKKHKIGLFDKNIRKKAMIKTQKKLKEQHKGFYNLEVQRELGRRGGKIGGPAAILAVLNNSPYIFKGVHYSNNSEMEIGMNIDSQIEKIIIRKNFQVKVGTKPYDFLIEKYKCFIEYHPWDRKLTDKEYYKYRRKNLDDNGYKDYNLVVIK